MGQIVDQISTVLSRALSYRLDRHHLLSSNVANADTPGYTPVDLQFDDLLKANISGGAMELTHQNHMSATTTAGKQGRVVYDPSSLPGLDGNSVSLDREMARIAENLIQYNATAKALQKRMAMLRYAANEGG